MIGLDSCLSHVWTTCPTIDVFNIYLLIFNFVRWQVSRLETYCSAVKLMAYHQWGQ